MEGKDLSPIAVLRSYLDAMRQWNVRCMEAGKKGELFSRMEEMEERLNGIFDRHLTAKAGICEIPEQSGYGFAVERILSCTIDRKRAHIEMLEGAGFEGKSRYTFHFLKREGWRIAGKKTYDESSGRWKSCPDKRNKNVNTAAGFITGDREIS